MSSTQEVSTFGNINDVWVAVEPTEMDCEWGGKNKFRIICCKDAFSINSACKFACCPQCAMDIQDKGEVNRSKKKQKKNSRASTRRKSGGNVSDVVTKTHGNDIKDGEGECGKHTLMDLLTMGYEETSKGYLKSKREKIKGAHNIAEHCVKCGVKF